RSLRKFRKPCWKPNRMAVLITAIASRLVRKTTRKSFRERLKRGNFMRASAGTSADSSAPRREAFGRRGAFTGSSYSAASLRARAGRLDGDQLDIEHQGALGSARAGRVVVGQAAGDPEPETIAHRHQRNRFLPARDELIQREGRRLAPHH